MFQFMYVQMKNVKPAIAYRNEFKNLSNTHIEEYLQGLCNCRYNESVIIPSAYTFQTKFIGKIHRTVEMRTMNNTRI